MKKAFLSLFVFTLFFFVVGCVSVESIKSDFEEGGYTYSANASSWISTLLTELQQKEIPVTASVFSKGLQTSQLQHPYFLKDFNQPSSWNLNPQKI